MDAGGAWTLAPRSGQSTSQYGKAKRVSVRLMQEQQKQANLHQLQKNIVDFPLKSPSLKLFENIPAWQNNAVACFVNAAFNTLLGHGNYSCTQHHSTPCIWQLLYNNSVNNCYHQVSRREAASVYSLVEEINTITKKRPDLKINPHVMDDANVIVGRMRDLMHEHEKSKGPAENENFINQFLWRPAEKTTNCTFAGCQETHLFTQNTRSILSIDFTAGVSSNLMKTLSENIETSSVQRPGVNHECTFSTSFKLPERAPEIALIANSSYLVNILLIEARGNTQLTNDLLYVNLDTIGHGITTPAENPTHRLSALISYSPQKRHYVYFQLLSNDTWLKVDDSIKSAESPSAELTLNAPLFIYERIHPKTVADRPRTSLSTPSTASSTVNSTHSLSATPSHPESPKLNRPPTPCASPPFPPTSPSPHTQPDPTPPESEKEVEQKTGDLTSYNTQPTPHFPCTSPPKGHSTIDLVSPTSSETSVFSIDSKDGKHKRCSVCHDGGVLQTCDACPRVYHHECIDLDDIPSEDRWECQRCVHHHSVASRESEVESVFDSLDEGDSEHDKEKEPLTQPPETQSTKRGNKTDSSYITPSWPKGVLNSTLGHVCQYKDCTNKYAFNTSSKLSGHCRKDHTTCPDLSDGDLLKMDMARCPNCQKPYGSTGHKQHFDTCIRKRVEISKRRPIVPPKPAKPTTILTITLVEDAAHGLEDFSLVQVGCINRRTFPHDLPSEVIPEYNEITGMVMDLVTSERAHSTENYTKLLSLLPHLILPPIPRGQGKNAKHRNRGANVYYTQHIGKHISDFKENISREWLKEKVNMLLSVRGKKNPLVPTNEKTLKNLSNGVKRNVGLNKLGKAAECIDKMASIVIQESKNVPGLVVPITPAVLEQLKERHPQHKAKLPDRQLSPVAQIVPSHASIAKAILSFKPESGTGPSGASAHHFRAFLSTEKDQPPTVGMIALHRLFTRIIEGNAPAHLGPWTGSAKLLALSKPEAGAVRPIAVGEVIRRILAKAIILEIEENKIANYLRPIQRGVGVQGGPEQIVHTVRAWLRDKNHVVLTVDIKNAFNEIERKAILEQITLLFPELTNITQFLYGDNPNLFLSDFDIIKSINGSQQGDPFAGLFFAVGVHPALQESIRMYKNESPNSKDLLIAGHDDIYICGESVKSCHRIFEILKVEMDKIALQFGNKNKMFTEGGAVATTPIEEKDDMIRYIPSNEGIIVFGVPVGAEEWTENQLLALALELTPRIQMCENFDNPQVTNQIITSTCITRPLHILRAICPSATLTFAKVIDQLHFIASAHLSGLSKPAGQLNMDTEWENIKSDLMLDNWAVDSLIASGMEHDLAKELGGIIKQQVHLPKDKGGLQLSKLELIRYAAFLGSWALAIREGILTDFPFIMDLFNCSGDQQTPEVLELVKGWRLLSSTVDTRRCPCGHEDHSNLACFVLLSQDTTGARPNFYIPAVEDDNQPQNFAHRLQHKFTVAIRKTQYDSFIDGVVQKWASANGDFKSAYLATWNRLMAVKGDCAHAWLDAKPGGEINNFMTNFPTIRSFTVAICLRLGLPLPREYGHQPDYPTQCDLHSNLPYRVTRFNNHFFNCLRAKNEKHQALGAGLYRSMQQLAGPGFRLIMEAARLLDSNKRPADLLIVRPDGTRHAIDVTSTSFDETNYAGKTPTSVGLDHLSGKDAHAAEAAKILEYGDLCNEKGLLFSPFAIEFHGAFGKHALQTLQWISECELSQKVSKKQLIEIVSVAFMGCLSHVHDDRVSVARGKGSRWSNRQGWVRPALDKHQRGLSASSPPVPGCVVYSMQQQSNNEQNAHMNTTHSRTDTVTKGGVTGSELVSSSSPIIQHSRYGFASGSPSEDYAEGKRSQEGHGGGSETPLFVGGGSDSPYVNHLYDDDDSQSDPRFLPPHS